MIADLNEEDLHQMPGQSHGGEYLGLSSKLQ